MFELQNNNLHTHTHIYLCYNITIQIVITFIIDIYIVKFHYILL